MFCKYCGTLLKDDAKFCGSCGAAVEKAAPIVEEPAVEAPAPVVEEPAVEAPAPVVEEPVVEAAAPVVEEPVVEAPAPVIEEPVVEAPAPVVEEPAVEAPAPVSEAPTPVYVPAPVVEAAAPVYAPTPVYTPPVQQTYTAPSPSTKKIMTEAGLPEEYRPMGAWSYVGLQLLFSVPIVGLVFLIIFTFKRSNLNRRAFARSYWCWLAILGVIVLTAVILGVIGGASIERLY